jgi:hypothetical protein
MLEPEALFFFDQWADLVVSGRSFDFHGVMGRSHFGRYRKEVQY